MTTTFLKNCKAVYEAQGENALYYIDANAFLREGEEDVCVVPLFDNSGVIGIVLEHSFWNEEDGFFETYQEMFEFPDEEKETVNARKLQRAIRIERNRRHKGSDRAHGKKRPMSRKDAVRANNDQAQMTRPIGMWCEGCKGDYVFRPFQRSNRHNNYVSPEQEHLNLLKVGAQRVSVQDVNWAKAVVQNAAEEGQEWTIYDALAEAAGYCPAAEKEVALLTAIGQSLWTEQFDGYVKCDLPATRDCLDSINHNDWYKWAVKQEVPMVVEPWTPNV